jgi:hypothetical protein
MVPGKSVSCEHLCSDSLKLVCFWVKCQAFDSVGKLNLSCFLHVL